MMLPMATPQLVFGPRSQVVHLQKTNYGHSILTDLYYHRYFHEKSHRIFTNSVFFSFQQAENFFLKPYQSLYPANGKTVVADYTSPPATFQVLGKKQRCHFTVDCALMKFHYRRADRPSRLFLCWRSPPYSL